jgi:DNA helicase II / ATP-dependent DNA helicase PcrA
MNTYEVEYKRLNSAQKQAVDSIDGPLLVIAGPGTGKTQLLSARVAKILEKTDTVPQNIVCLTFTETGAANMRERLTRFIGQAAYDVQISTYHAFGGDLIQRYPEFFQESRLQSPVDQLGQHQILRVLVDKMSYQNPLKQSQHHIGDLISTVSEVKRALLTPHDLRTIAKENKMFIAKASDETIKIFSGLATTSSFKLAFPRFVELLPALQSLIPNKPANTRFSSLAQLAVTELAEAILAAEETGKTTLLTKWKNAWLAKNADNHFVFDGQLENERILALADVCEQYASALEAHGLYDFDDMILRSITALESNDEFKFTLQERYQYILLDEFQDTNAAQARLVTLLTDNPVSEGRPNIMAVGDDDQAIYAFQGAMYSNMLDFYNQYRDVQVVNLTENYRSHGDILETAHNIAGQITERLHHQFDGMSKELVAAGKTHDSFVARTEFLSDVAQYNWIAESVERLVSQGTNPSEIAILAPRHKYLEPLVGYLNELNIPVRYEKRENILETSVIQQIIAIARLLHALSSQNRAQANALWPQVLSFEFWQIPISTVWELSWQVNDHHKNWADVALANPRTRPVALLLLTLASRAVTETCEAILDLIIGTEDVKTNETDIPTVRSPLRMYYTSEHMQQDRPELFYETLSHLTVLREKLRDHQYAAEEILQLKDLIELVELYENAGERMLDSSPYSQAAEAVQLMTVYKSKGLEFEHVFVICCQDDVWGSTSRSSANRLTLPANLKPIRKSGTTDDERLRILFVAITRAKSGLYLTSFRNTFAGRLTKSLKYLNEQEQEDGSRRSLVLPAHAQLIMINDSERPAIEALATNWQHRHLGSLPNLKLQQLLEERIARYQLSPTHLNQFTDVIYGGPQKFFMNTILRFPQAPTINGQYGSAVHETLEWVQHQVNDTTKVPSTKSVIDYFAAVMKKASLTPAQIELETERGAHALAAYMKARGAEFKPGNIAEHNFKNEGVFVGEAHLGGKIDLIEVDQKTKTVCVVDYKTGSWYAKWKSDAKLHKYAEQLYAYKLLIEGSHRFKGYTVTSGRIEFIEPDGQGEIYHLPLEFEKPELERIQQLLQAMWKRVKALDLPEISRYSKDLKGIQALEADLINKI